MVIAIDAGNTKIHWGCYEGEKQLGYLECESRAFSPGAGARLLGRLTHHFRGRDIEGGVIVSVSPRLTRRLVLCLRMIRAGIEPVIVSYRLKSPLHYGYRRPHTLGADRIANAVGALERYRSDIIVVAAGTATTVDVVFKNGWFPGGMIMPGIETGLWALTRKTDRLKGVGLLKPRRIVGRTTGECLRSGVMLGHASMIEALLLKLNRRYRREFKCIATGGWGRFIAANARGVTRYDRDLTLYGAVQLFRRNFIE